MLTQFLNKINLDLEKKNIRNINEKNLEKKQSKTKQNVFHQALPEEKK